MNTPSQDAKSTKVLMVEDDLSIRIPIAKRFRAEGFEVIEAADGAEGLATAILEHPDVILLDLMLPIMDGLTILSKLRQKSEWGKKVPVIILTNTERIDRQAIEGSPAYYLTKSQTKIETVIEKVRDVLKPN